MMGLALPEKERQKVWPEYVDKEGLLVANRKKQRELRYAMPCHEKGGHNYFSSLLARL